MGRPVIWALLRSAGEPEQRRDLRLADNRIAEQPDGLQPMVLAWVHA